MSLPEFLSHVLPRMSFLIYIFTCSVLLFIIPTNYISHASGDCRVPWRGQSFSGDEAV